MRADLHVHSSASDGTDPPAEVMRRAAQAGLDVVALTDHDTVAGHAEARAAAGRLSLLPGMELSCRRADPVVASGACTCWPTCSTRTSPSWPPSSPGSGTTG